MRDPDVELVVDLDVACKNFLAGRTERPAQQYAQRSEPELRGDLTRVTDLSIRVIAERDKLQAEKTVAQIAAGNSTLWIKVLAGAATVEGLIIGWFATELFSRLGPK